MQLVVVNCQQQLITNNETLAFQGQMQCQILMGMQLGLNTSSACPFTEFPFLGLSNLILYAGYESGIQVFAEQKHKP